MSPSSQQLQLQLLGSSDLFRVLPVCTFWPAKSSNLITVATLGCHTLDNICWQSQSYPETSKELWEKTRVNIVKVTYFDSCGTWHSCLSIVIAVSLRTTLTQLRPVRGQTLRRDGVTAAWDPIQEPPAEVKRIVTVA